MSDSIQTKQPLPEDVKALQAEVARLQGQLAAISQPQSPTNAPELPPYLTLLEALGKALTEPATLPQQLQLLSQAVVDQIGVAAVRIWLLNQPQQWLESKASAGSMADRKDSQERIPIGPDIISSIAQLKEPYFTKNLLGSSQIGPNGEMVADGHSSFFGFPLRLRDQLFGIMGLYAQHSLSDELVTAMQSVANFAALAIDQRRTEATLINRATQLETVAQVSTATLTILDRDQLLDRVVNLTKARFQLYHVHLYLLDETDRVLRLIAGSSAAGAKMVAQGWQISLDTEQSIVATVARTREGKLINNVREAANFLANPLLPDTQAELAVPLLVGNQVLGVLDVQSDRPDSFDRDDLQIQTTLAAQVAIALENARLFAEVERKARREALVNHISQRIQSTTSVERALQVTARELGQALQAQHVKVRLDRRS